MIITMTEMFPLQSHTASLHGPSPDSLPSLPLQSRSITWLILCRQNYNPGEPQWNSPKHRKDATCCFTLTRL